MGRLRVAALGISAPLAALVVGVAASAAPTRATRYCDTPDPIASLAASPRVTCATAKTIEKALKGRCFADTSCLVEGFRCAAYWDGRFDRRFSFTHYAICVHGQLWAIWNGG